MLELIFHCRMLEYPCLASDPQSADAIYLPYYADIDALRYLYGLDYNSSFEQGLFCLIFLLGMTQFPGIGTWVKTISWFWPDPLWISPSRWGTIHCCGRLRYSNCRRFLMSSL
ncbi:hypothetical protein PS1_038164 [Malus domestica]